MTERRAQLLYRITLSSQGGWLRCHGCGAQDYWSPEFGEDGETVDRYLCLAPRCGRMYIMAGDVVGREVVDGRADSLLAVCGHIAEDAIYEQRNWAAAAGLDDEATYLNEWIEAGGVA